MGSEMCIRDRLGRALDGQSVAVVGQATAKLVQQCGGHVTQVATTSLELLETAVLLTPPVLICRGVHARLDLAEALRGRGIEARAAVLYDQAACALTNEARALLHGPQAVIAPVFSPRSSALLSTEPRHAPMQVIAISKSAADAWDGPETIAIAARPDAEAMCEIVVAAL